MPMRFIALGGAFVLLMVGVLLVVSTWTTERAVTPAAKPDVAATPGVPSMVR